MVEKMAEKGLAGLSRCFRGALLNYGKPAKLLFVGSPFTCLPFAEFLCYSIRDLPIEPHFMAGADAGKVREIIKEDGIGYQLGNDASSKKYDIVVLLGGLALSKMPVDPKALKWELMKVSDLKFTIALFFQGVMRKPEWLDEYSFKYLVDADISRVVLEGFV